MTKVRILAISGSGRRESYARKLLHLSEGYFVGLECEYVVFDLVANPLPVYDEEEHSLRSQNVQTLLSRARGADGFVLCSPEYHGSMSGALKNALDWLNYLEDSGNLKGKVVGLMGGGGSFGNSGATLQMMMAVRTLHGWIMPDVLMSVPKISAAFDEHNQLKDPRFQNRMKHFAENLVQYTKMFRANRNLFN